MIARAPAWLTLTSLLLVAFAVRGAALWGLGRHLERDPDTYRELAFNLLEHRTFGYVVHRGEAAELRPTAYRPPLYPLLLAGLGRQWLNAAGVAGLHLVLGLATVLLTYRLGLRWYGAGTGYLAAMLIAVDPILLNQSALVMTETLATFLAVLAWYWLSRAAEGPRIAVACAAGAALGLAALCRATFLVWLAALLAVLLIQAVRRRSFRNWIGVLVTSSLVLLPWGLRNLAVFGRPIFSSTHGGYTLWLANNPEFYAFLRQAPRGAVWDSARLDARHDRRREKLGDEVAADRWAREQAIQSIRAEPAMFAYSCAVRVGWLWGLVPHRVSPAESPWQRTARYAVGVWYAAVLGFALLGVVRLRRQLLRSPLIWGLLLCGTFTAVHCFYWSNIRMRAPLMPVVCLLAAAGIARVAQPLGWRLCAGPLGVRLRRRWSGWFYLPTGGGGVWIVSATGPATALKPPSSARRTRWIPRRIEPVLGTLTGLVPLWRQT